MAGYSGTPLTKKLGVKAGHTIMVIEAPEGFALELPDDVTVRKRLGDDGALTLESPPAHVRKVLELTGVTAHVAIVP